MTSPPSDAASDRRWSDFAPGRVHQFFDEPAQDELERIMNEIGADEGTLWIVDARDENETLVPVASTSPRRDEFVGRHRQPLSVGIVSMVCVSEQPFADVEVHRHASQDPTLDRMLALRTWAMAAVPFYLDGVCHGVVSAVQLMPADVDRDPRPGFDAAQLGRLQQAAEALADHLLRSRPQA